MSMDEMLILKDEIEEMFADVKGFFASALEKKGIKSVQRGVYSGAAGTINISAVEMFKTFALSVSKGSSGQAGTLPTTFTGTVTDTPRWGGGSSYGYINSLASYPQSGTIAGTNTSNLYVKEYSAKLTSPTQLTADGPCEWQVIEFY